MTALLHFKVRQHLPYYSSFYSQQFEQQMWSKQLASAGNRTRAARVAGEHSTTEPPMRTILLGSWHSSLHLVSEWKLLGWPCTTCQVYIWCHKCLNEHCFVTLRHFWDFFAASPPPPPPPLPLPPQTNGLVEKGGGGGVLALLALISDIFRISEFQVSVTWACRLNRSTEYFEAKNPTIPNRSMGCRSLSNTVCFRL